MILEEVCPIWLVVGNIPELDWLVGGTVGTNPLEEALVGLTLPDVDVLVDP